MRLDQYLHTFFNLQSRNKASELIKAHQVLIDGKIITKSSFHVTNENKIEILKKQNYVSRSAQKLHQFLIEFPIELKNTRALDIGSSTGGFTQVLLENSVSSITCVDVGDNQLHKILRNNPKLRIEENTDIRNFSDSPYETITCDVSFISILNIIQDIDRLAKKNIIILFKPQYEVGNDVKRNRAGVVQNQEAINIARNNFISKAIQLDWKLIHQAKSKVAGKNGNVEELFHFEKN